ncbi:MAG TPA: hypothetical protein VJ625_13195 [Propionibacteriaceae bacterium]|nr:hypothetical protein [Propionibacteriaceae bacterium]
MFGETGINFGMTVLAVALAPKTVLLGPLVSVVFVCGQPDQRCWRDLLGHRADFGIGEGVPDPASSGRMLSLGNGHGAGWDLIRVQVTTLAESSTGQRRDLGCLSGGAV